MKFSLVKNDKSTAVDEIILMLIVLVSLVVGILLIHFKPSIWIIDSESSVFFGAIFIVIALMFFPCGIYRFFENEVG